MDDLDVPGRRRRRAASLAGAGSWWELLIPVGLVALFPAIEWVIHVVHPALAPAPARPGRDRLAARAQAPRPTTPTRATSRWCSSRGRALVWLLPAYVVVAWLATPSTTSMLSLLVSVYGIKLGYEWTHYLVHSDYRPRSRWFRSVWRNHRLHHYKNEHYWFTVTTAGTADRLFGTYPDPAGVETSPTVRSLHSREGL